MARTSREAIHSYITDMLALEEHIEKALQAQVNDYREDHPEVIGMIAPMHLEIERHIATLKGLEEYRDAGAGHDVADFIKRAVAGLAGVGAAAIDLVRTEQLPKNLRDDYTAFSLAAIGYSMLFTTATALGEATVAGIAERHLADYAKMIMGLNRIIPRTVLDVLAKDGLPADASILPKVQDAVHRAWRPEGQ